MILKRPQKVKVLRIFSWKESFSLGSNTVALIRLSFNKQGSSFGASGQERTIGVNWCVVCLRNCWRRKAAFLFASRASIRKKDCDPGLCSMRYCRSRSGCLKCSNLGAFGQSVSADWIHLYRVESGSKITTSFRFCGIRLVRWSSLRNRNRVSIGTHPA